MADPRGFLTVPTRQNAPRRPVPVRIRDWHEVYQQVDGAVLREQAGRCMDCGVPFCHNGCPLGNLIPEWNDLTRRGDFREASAAVARRSDSGGGGRAARLRRERFRWHPRTSRDT